MVLLLLGPFDSLWITHSRSIIGSGGPTANSNFITSWPLKFKSLRVKETASIGASSYKKMPNDMYCASNSSPILATSPLAFPAFASPDLASAFAGPGSSRLSSSSSELPEKVPNAVVARSVGVGLCRFVLKGG